MDARAHIMAIPLETVVEIVRILTADRADPQFVRAIAMNIKQFKEQPKSNGQVASAP